MLWSTEEVPFAPWRLESSPGCDTSTAQSRGDIGQPLQPRRLPRGTGARTLQSRADARNPPPGTDAGSGRGPTNANPCAA